MHLRAKVSGPRMQECGRPRCARTAEGPESLARVGRFSRDRNEAMKIDKSQHDDYATLTLKGEFDTFYCHDLIDAVEEQIERGVNHLILDMHLVKFINSTASMRSWQ